MVQQAPQCCTKPWFRKRMVSGFDWFRRNHRNETKIKFDRNESNETKLEKKFDRNEINDTKLEKKFDRNETNETKLKISNLA